MATALMGTVAAHQAVIRTSQPHIAALRDAPARPVVLVLGARVDDGQPCDMLEDRLTAALELYRTRRGEKILLSGAHHRRNYDEVGVMRRWLEARGVPPVDIYLDHAGLRTFDSLVRAKEIFGVESALVVSQDFHVPRAVYVGREIGLDVVGVPAPPQYRYSRGVRARNEARERAARVAAWLDLHVLGTRPRHLGDPIDLDAPGTRTH